MVKFYISLLTLIIIPVIYLLQFLYGWKIYRAVEKTGVSHTRLQFAVRFLKVNFLFYICVYLLSLVHIYVSSTPGSEYGPGFEISLFSMFALFIYPIQALIIFVGSLLIFPFAKRKLDMTNINIQINATNSEQIPKSDWISIVTKTLLTFFVLICIFIYFYFFY